MHNGFQPIYDKNSKILILGSFPSVKSRQNNFYYGNPQNRFWKMIFSVFNSEFSSETDKKIEFLLKNNIALYDVVSESDLKGSADLTLEKSNKKNADLAPLLPPNTVVEKIICNGKTAYKILSTYPQFENDFFAVNGKKIPILCLPSTSSANPRFDAHMWQDAILKK